MKNQKKQNSQQQSESYSLSKFIAHAGIASRRDATKLIKGGNVRVNGEIVREPGAKVDPDKDTILYRNKPVGVETEKYLYLVHKPVGVVSTTRKYKGQKNILDLVPSDTRLFPVGRLDKESEGLMLLTNDGAFANEMMHPRYQKDKEYEVWTNKPVDQKHLVRLKKGVELSEGIARVRRIRVIKPDHLNLLLTQGMNKQIRRTLQKLGYKVIRLKRIRVGNFRLGSIKPGRYKEIKMKS